MVTDKQRIYGGIGTEIYDAVFDSKPNSDNPIHRKAGKNLRVVGDSNKCIGCNTCEIACIISHYKPGLEPVARLKVVKTDEISVPVMCRQCVDPDCAKACTQHAIYSNGISVLVNPDKCIGCYDCTGACEYASIHVHKSVEPLSFMGLELKNERAFAVKCDLCQHRVNGPSCVEVCPSGALSVVESEKYEQRENELFAQVR